MSSFIHTWPDNPYDMPVNKTRKPHTNDLDQEAHIRYFLCIPTNRNGLSMDLVTPASKISKDTSREFYVFNGIQKRLAII